MGLNNASEVAWELYEELCYIAWEIEDPEDRDVFAAEVADAFVKLVKNQQ